MNIENNLFAELNAFDDILDVFLLGEINNLVSEFNRNIEESREKGRNLRIAVIGQMKSGKSSFLNAAFFGRDLLPKAETPMTAALTKITYSTDNYVEITFYTRSDWDEIEKHANNYQLLFTKVEHNILSEMKSLSSREKSAPKREEILNRIPDIVKSSYELVNHAKERGLQVEKYLGKTIRVDHIKDASDFMASLHEYVGSGGKYTPITKMSTLYVNDARLEGLEIIDTPGFNDPIISRGQITRSYLGQCDVIFLLSSISQFLTSTDMSILREQLPEAGINEKAIFLVGTQLDLALRQDREIIKKAEIFSQTRPIEERSKAKVSAILQLLETKMSEHAMRSLELQINMPEQDEKTKKILSAVKNSKPKFVSSWCWLMAENYNTISDDDSDQLASLNSVTGYNFEPTSLRALSKVPALRDEILNQKTNKQKLIQSKEQALLSGVKSGIINRLRKIIDDLDLRKANIEKYNIKDLEDMEKSFVSKLNKGRAILEDIFDEELSNIKTRFALLQTECQRESNRFSAIRSGSETKTVEYEVSISKLIKPWTWGKTETRHKTVVSEYAYAQDAIENIDNFANSLTVKLQEQIMECINIDLLRQKLKKAAISLFDLGDENFDADILINEVNKSVRKIKIPSTNFGRESYSALLIQDFGSGKVWGSDVNALISYQHELLTTIIRDLHSEVDKKTNYISNLLHETGSVFVNNMCLDIQNSLMQLRRDINHKIDTINRIATAKDMVVIKLQNFNTQNVNL